MPSNKKFLKLAHRIAVRDRPSFDELLEYEKKKRIRTKEKVNFTVDKSVAQSFRRHCSRHGYNMSAKIEKAMEKMLEEEK